MALSSTTIAMEKLSTERFRRGIRSQNTGQNEYSPRRQRFGFTAQ
jgi:hypothetical protein